MDDQLSKECLTISLRCSAQSQQNPLRVRHDSLWESMNSHDYFEPISGENCWLCEYGTQMGLGGANKLYLKLTLTNPG